MLQDALQTTRHISFLQSGKQVMRLLKVSAQGVHTDFHHALILTLAAQHLQLDQAMACGESTLISFLSDSGVTAKKRQTVQHELLRPVRKKRRKSEKQQHKKRRKSKHDRAEQADSDDSLNDVDLGIMSSDTDLKSGSDVWQLDIPDCSGIPVPLENLPHVFLYHSLLRWLAAKA